MVHFQNTLVCLIGLAVASSSHAGTVEEVVFRVSNNSEDSVIVPALVNGSYTLTSGAVNVTETEQADTVSFEKTNILVKDQKRDDLGWKLVPSYSNQKNDNESVIFVNAVTESIIHKDVGSTPFQGQNSLLHTFGFAVTNHTIDYELSGPTPSIVGAGSKTG